MISSSTQNLIPLLGCEDANMRMLALHWLMEEYCDADEVTAAVFDAWDRFGVEQAFEEFPMISYFPIAPNRISEVCERAKAMAAGSKITELPARCGGKLMEQLVQLPASQLKEHVEAIEETVASSKIFFRVDVAALKRRIDMLDTEADQLAEVLNNSIAQLMENTEDTAAYLSGIHALEALRRQHPEYMDLSSSIDSRPADSGPSALSFMLTIHSLNQFPEAGMETCLSRHVDDDRQSIFVPAIEALVRQRNVEAANVLLAAVERTTGSNQQWVIRALQRMRIAGIADRVAELRETMSEPTLWVMLYVAQTRQLEIASAERLAADLNRINGLSTVLVNAIAGYLRVHAEDERAVALHNSFVGYLERVQSSAQAESNAPPPKAIGRAAREKARERLLEQYRKRKS